MIPPSIGRSNSQSQRWAINLSLRTESIEIIDWHEIVVKVASDAGANEWLARNPIRWIVCRRLRQIDWWIAAFIKHTGIGLSRRRCAVTRWLYNALLPRETLKAVRRTSLTAGLHFAASAATGDTGTYDYLGVKHKQRSETCRSIVRRDAAWRRWIDLWLLDWWLRSRFTVMICTQDKLVFVLQAWIIYDE